MNKILKTLLLSFCLHHRLDASDFKKKLHSALWRRRGLIHLWRPTEHHSLYFYEKESFRDCKIVLLKKKSKVDRIFNILLAEI